MSRPNKYHAIKTEYKGITYDSKKEAQYAAQLDLLRHAIKPSERVVKVERQPSFELQSAPDRIVYRADFRAWYGDGRIEVVDTKGAMTPVFRLKLKLMKQRYPEINVRIL
jgi:hypothetical protein